MQVECIQQIFNLALSKNILLVLKVLIKLNFTVTSDNSIRDISDKMNEKHATLG